MADYRIRMRQLCNLCKENRWQSWLHNIAPELHANLMEFLASSRGCRANHDVMLVVYKKLEEKGRIQDMVKFLIKEYPYAVEEITPKPQAKLPDESKILDRLDNQDVFQFYKPNVLTHPQKIVFQNDDREVLRKDVMNFIIGKIGVDFIVVGNKAFVEYFKPKFADESRLVPTHMRDLYKYRMRHGLPMNIYEV